MAMAGGSSCRRNCYGSGCEWLRRRAAYTGSGYWWDRYYACVNGYY